MAVALTGASGFIGRAVASILAERGETVYGLSRQDPGIPSANFQAWDIRSAAPTAVRSLARTVRAVVHCAGIASVRAPADDLYAVRVTGTRNVLDAFPKAQVIHLSTTAVYATGDPHVDLWEEAGPVQPDDYRYAYPRTHAEAERLVDRIRPDATILRPAPVYGAGETMFMPALAQMARKGTLRVPGGGGQNVTLTHIDNLVRAVLVCLERTGVAGRFNIGDPAPYRLKDAVATHFARMNYEPVAFETTAADKALVTAKSALKARSLFGKGDVSWLFLLEYLRHERTYNLSRQHQVLGLTTAQYLKPSRYA